MVKLHLVLRKRQGSLTSFQLGVGRVENFLLLYGAGLASLLVGVRNSLV
jgi:hypothetical protein